MLPLSGERKPFPFLKTEFVEEYGSFSPDGKWVAYESSETGQEEIYVRAFPGVEAGASSDVEYRIRGKWRISIGGGKHARWRRDGRELFYRTDDGKIMAVEISASPNLPAPACRGYCLKPASSAQTLASFAVTADGQRFLILPRLKTNSQPRPWSSTGRKS